MVRMSAWWRAVGVHVGSGETYRQQEMEINRLEKGTISSSKPAHTDPRRTNLGIVAPHVVAEQVTAPA